jgi:hypothetical protein
MDWEPSSGFSGVRQWLWNKGIQSSWYQLWTGLVLWRASFGRRRKPDAIGNIIPFDDE